MNPPRVRLTLRQWTAVVAVFAALISLYLVMLPKPRECMPHGLWRAAAVSGRPGNDLWIEYNGFSRLPVMIYRDFDGDGVVDERILLCGPVTSVYRSSRGDGVLDTCVGVAGAPGRVETLPRDASEAGPFTRDRLDEEVRTSPFDPPPVL